MGRAEIALVDADKPQAHLKQLEPQLMADCKPVTTARLADYHRADADDPATRGLRTPWEQE
jgi:hypothetical protein